MKNVYAMPPRAKNSHTGVTDAIKSIIKLHGPQTVPDLMKATGFKDASIRHAIEAALTRTGGIVYAGKRNGIQLYGFPGIHVPKAPDRPKPYVAEFKEMTPKDRNLYAARDLAMLTR